MHLSRTDAYICIMKALYIPSTCDVELYSDATALSQRLGVHRNTISSWLKGGFHVGDDFVLTDRVTMYKSKRGR